MNSKAADILADLEQEPAGKGKGPQGGRRGRGRQGKGTYIKHRILQLEILTIIIIDDFELKQSISEIAVAISM